MSNEHTVSWGDDGLGSGFAVMISVVDSVSVVADAARKAASLRAYETGTILTGLSQGCVITRGIVRQFGHLGRSIQLL